MIHRRYALLSAFVIGSGLLLPLPAGAGVAQWDFDGDLESTVGGDALTAEAAAPATVPEVSFEVYDIDGEDADVAGFTRGTYFRLRHGLGANGGGQYLNICTLVMDVMFPDRTPSGGWAALLQTSPSNANDGDWFINGGSGVGISGNYGGFVGAGEWHRVALVVDLPAGTFTSYVDGAWAMQNTGEAVDGRFSLEEEALIFADEGDEENSAGFVNSVQLVNYAMTEDELSDLGGPSAEGIPLPPEEECRVTDPSQDCNSNDIRDECDLRLGTSLDCNANGIPDECDIASGESEDCDGNGVPDECEVAMRDCNGNEIIDACEIAADPSKDCDGNGILDECQVGDVIRFEFDGDLSEASGKMPLEESYAAPAVEPEVEFETVDIGGEDATVAHFARGTYFRMENDLPANGGGMFLNQYTLIMDVMFPDRSPSGGWAALWQTNPDNGDDGDWFINPANGVGISGNYGGSVLAGEWHRLALVVDFVKGTFTSYVDGAQVQQNVGIGAVDERFAAQAFALLFADLGDEENAEGYVNSVQLRGYAMADVEIADLGGPTAEGIRWDDCNRNGIPDSCDIASGSSADTNANGVPDECEGIVGVRFIRGDTDGNGTYTLGDGVQILERLFANRQAYTSDCEDTGDLDDNGFLTIGDAIQVFNYLFASGTEPAPPAVTCGVDPTPATTLGCASYPQGSCL
ncbi:MAG: hypothetical protein JXP34_01275 [Planctomycetes bacterium]|nr:hypothetical protein [Planctomycetota bacterium]